MKNLTVSETKNHITGLHEIGVLSFVSAFGVWATVPVYAVALHDDGVVSQFEVDHKLIEHDDLLFKGDMVSAQSISHRTFDVSALARGETLEIAKYGVFLAAILGSLTARWNCLKFLSAVGANKFNAFLPDRALLSSEQIPQVLCGAFARAITLTSRCRRTDRELLAATFARLGNLLNVFVHLIDAVVSFPAFVGAVFGIARTTCHDKKVRSANNTSFGNTWRLATFVGTEDVNTFSAAGFRYVNRLAASGAGVKRHKRNLLSDGWHVCLGHAAPTGGIHNYIRLGANHQAHACPKQLHYSTDVLVGVIT